ncbi:MAG TPA: hypothetical protein DCY36_04180 [Acidimicrobiaceae bacterium]|jgi:phenylacetate-CoA oxygenase PaaH subunit|nr:hypothetical protein [Acidimicrobiaceae bacterium]MCH2633527.1 hypothetical protein [Acidimicrobiales bacterium]HAY65205.1 hypothetical protein [Acidimicrobiaceae bacterium]HBV25408.1 hypothetical protein [Acidimicrobiaceae bacterium]HCK74154.1 hypothetical protein [Acidimicrobiaceae bacterium]|tara:strand:+ start:381 stop:671 length:291 start_codon:yes stop_codon:yes gene_type:complete
MNTYEVFLKKDGKESFNHAGSLEAPDDGMALTYARETYGRRNEGDQMWVVARDSILIANQDDLKMADRSHKHNDGKLVAELRRSNRSSGEDSDAAF